MKKELFNELRISMEQALAYAQGKITLRTKQVPVPKKVTALPPRVKKGTGTRTVRTRRVSIPATVRRWAGHVPSRRLPGIASCSVSKFRDGTRTTK
jgi:hypothetical protein